MKKAVIVLGALLAAAAGMFTGARPASAHNGVQSFLYLDIGDRGVSGRVEFPVVHAKDFLGIDLLGSGDDLDSAVAAATPALQEFAAKHLTIGTSTERWPLQFDNAEMLAEFPEEPKLNYVVIPFSVDKELSEVPAELDVTFDPFFDKGKDGLLLIGNHWRAGIVDNGETSLLRFDSGNPNQSVKLDGGSLFTSFRSSIKLGVDHIRTGPDHILFIFVLLLPSVLLFGSTWMAAPTFAGALWRVLKIVTMFTAAHTITFCLAGLDILPLPPSKVIESIIAISIALVALHNLRPVMLNKEWLIAFGFGLFHGMGFASLVDNLQVSRATQLASLLGRNVGIEIGQAAVVIAAFPMLYLLRRTQVYATVFKAGSVILAIVSIGWMIERVFELDLGINDFVEPLLRFPRALVPVVVLTAAAALWYRRERAAGRLTGVAGGASAG